MSHVYISTILYTCIKPVEGDDDIATVKQASAINMPH